MAPYQFENILPTPVTTLDFTAQIIIVSESNQNIERECERERE